MQNNIDRGITSPGNIDKADLHNGLDFVSTNNNYNVSLEHCLNKYGNEFTVPKLTFNNIINNLPYTFSSLNSEDKKIYLEKLNLFIREQYSKLGQNIENFENNDNQAEAKVECQSKNIFINILCIILVIIIIILFVLYITKNK